MAKESWGLTHGAHTGFHFFFIITFLDLGELRLECLDEQVATSKISKGTHKYLD